VVVDPGSRRDEALERVLDILRNDLKDAAVIYIGRRMRHDGMFSRVLCLEKDEAGKKLERVTEKHG
jgi:vitamin B12/bleomycin/antimicrobial peptide transport system ATP-binding/permease protein